MFLNSSKTFFVSLTGGFIGAFLFFSIISSQGKLYGTIISSSVNTDSQIIASPSIQPSASPDFWENIILDSSLSVVSVQVFKNNKLFGQGSGIVLSSDGIVVIPADLAVAGGIYQVIYEDKIIKGTIVKLDALRNLALLKINNTGMNVSDLSPRDYRSGQEIILVGKMMDLSDSGIVTQKGLISYIKEGKIILDTNPNQLLNGAKAVNSKGDLVGIFYVKLGTAYLVPGDGVKDFFENYIKNAKI